MNRQRNQAFEPVQFRAALYRPKQHRSVAVQLQHTVQGLRDALYSAITEIKSLKEENKALKEQVNLVENRWRQMESQLQEELRQKDELLKRISRKRQARTKAYIDCLALLSQKDKELKSREEQQKTGCNTLEARLQQELGLRDESWRKKVQEAANERNLEEEWKKISLLTSENKQLQKLVSKQQENTTPEEEKMENRDNKKVEEETKRSEDKQMNDTKEAKDEEWEEKEEQLATAEHPPS